MWEQEREPVNFKKYFGGAGLLGLAAALVLYGIAGLTTINPGEVGIMIKMIGENRGMQNETLDTGWRWVDPITYDVATYDVKFRQYDMARTSAETQDGQPIVLDLSFEIGLEDKRVPNLHETVGRNWYEEVVYPRARTAVRNASASQVSEVIYTAQGRAAIREAVDNDLADLRERGFLITTNVRNLQFADQEFVNTLNRKAKADQLEEIERREAKAAEQQAIKVANIAEGEKQKRIKAAEAQREELRLKGEGERLQKEEQAKGILAIAQANAEGTRLQVLAYGSGETYASVKWAESIGDNIKVYGVPTGAEGTNSIMDLTGALSGMASLRGVK